MKKARAYEVLGELYKYGQIDIPMLIQISDNIEFLNSESDKRKTMDNIEFVGDYPTKEQAEVGF